MNLDDAIVAHSAWKQKLALYIAKPDKSIDVAKLEKDDQCELGKWILTEAANYASEPAFQQLQKEHASFHKAAAAVVRRADSGEKVGQEVALGGKSAYAEASSKVVSAIVSMKRLPALSSR